ncbi:Uncharacterised protein [Mycobacterium tuberculosis]|nr:Uncharacterised protein [Mycobacterium tuberculosis]
MTRALPRTLTNASRSACGEAPWPVNSLATSESPVASPTITCSVETYSSSSSVASCCAVVIAANDSRDSCGCVLAPVACGKRSSADGGGLDTDSLQ